MKFLMMLKHVCRGLEVTSNFKGLPGKKTIFETKFQMIV